MSSCFISSIFYEENIDDEDWKREWFPGVKTGRAWNISFTLIYVSHIELQIKKFIWFLEMIYRRHFILIN